MNVAIRDMVATMYKDEAGSPILLTPSQVDIFEVISTRGASLHGRELEEAIKRWQIECHTRFGKSLDVALAVLTRAATFPEKWAIVAGTKDKAGIIMSYINAHIFDNEFTAGRFRMERGDSAEAIRRNRNKNHISFDVGNNLIGEVYICSAKDALGYGAPNVIEDESALVDDNDHALVMRMLGDNPNDNFLCKIGNPFRRNHFLKSSLDPKYGKIVVDCYKGVEEGRMTLAQIEEVKKYAYFDVLYECKFPSAESVDEEGWSYLLTEADLEQSKKRWELAEHYGAKKLGNDIARGGRNFNVWALRGTNYATILKKNHENDLMKVAGENIGYMQEHHIAPQNVALDDVGVGGGVTDRMKEQGFEVIAVKEGAKANEMEMRWNPKTKKDELMPVYANMRAQLYAGRNGLAEWVKRTGALDPAVDWEELTRIRYKRNSSGLVMIESKDDMRRRGEESPDVADALMLTFAGALPTQAGTFTPPDPASILGQGQKHGYL